MTAFPTSPDPRRRPAALVLAASAGLCLAALAAPAAGGSISFAAPVFFPTNDSPSGIAAGDLDGDGDIDLVTDSNTGIPTDPVRVHWNDGTGAFPTFTNLTAGDGPGNIALGDMDGDGNLDIFKACFFSNDMYFFPNNGDGSFGSPTAYATGSDCSGIDTGDIDGDGDIDFVATDHDGSRIRPYRNINGLGYASVGLFAAGDNPIDLTLGDMDGDGDLDVVVSNEDIPAVSVVYNDGSGQFPTQTTLPVGVRPTGVAVADFNGDGALDIVSADWGPLSPINNTVSVLLADGDGGFSPAVAYTAYGRPGTVRAADIDGDDVLDLVVACEADNGIAVLPGNGDGTFGDAVLFEIDRQPARIAVADLDGDGDVDIAAATNHQLAVLSNTSGGPTNPEALEVVWQRGYDNFFNMDYPSHVAVTPNGDVIVAGETSFSDNEQDYCVVAFDTDGNERWTYQYNGVGDHYDKIHDLRVDPAGNVIAMGQSWGQNFNVEWTTVKLDGDGNKLWVRRYDGGNPQAQQYPRGMEVAPDGRVAVCGWARDASFQTVHFSVVVYDADGTALWDAMVPGDENGQAEDVAFDSDGNVVVTGSLSNPSVFGDDTYTVKFGPTGDVLWADRGAVEGGDIVETDPSGNAYVADGDNLTKFAPDGTVIWQRSIGGIIFPYSLTFRPDGSFIVSGSGGSYVRMTAMTPAGDILWSTPTDVIFYTSNRAGHLALQPDGTIALLDQAGTDLQVIRYTGEGTLIDETRIDSGSSTDRRVAIAAAGDDLVAIGSYEPSVLNRRDFLVFKLSEAGGDACPADFAPPSGVLNIDDVLAFLDTYALSDPAADLTGDGLFNIDDVLNFIDAFVAGCP